MADCTGMSMFDPTCAVGTLGQGAAEVGTNGLADSLRDGAKWVMETTMGWWINVPSIDLQATPVQQIQAQVRWLAVAVAVAGVIWQGFRMAVMRKPHPLIDVGRGLITVVLWSAIGIVGVQTALAASDQYATWVLDSAAQGQVEQKLTGLAEMAEVQSSGAVIVLSLLMIIAGIAQAVLMFFREGAIIVLSGLVVLAAAGSFTATTRPWLQKWISWMLALILYKPVAATVYAVAIQVVGNGRDTRTIFIGLTMIVLSLIALPTLMKLFSFAVPAAVAGGAGLGAMGGAATAGIYAMGMRGIPQGGSVEQASSLSQDLGPQGGGGPTGPITISGGGPGSGPGAGGAGAAAVPDVAAGGAAVGTGAAAAAAPPAASGAAAASAGSAATAGGAAAGGAGAAAGPAGVAVAAAQAGAQAGQAAVGKAGAAMSGEPA
jgi:hypothetical protein